jgi:hypothetical protein
VLYSTYIAVSLDTFRTFASCGRRIQSYLMNGFDQVSLGNRLIFKTDFVGHECFELELGILYLTVKRRKKLPGQ